MSIKTYILQTLDDLSEADLARVAEFLAFLRFRNRFRAIPFPNEAQMAEMYADETKMAKAEDIIGRYRNTLQVLAK